MKNLELAFGHGTPLKAFITAILVGTILTAINHGDQIINGEFPHFAKIAMTYIVPYVVTTWGSMIGKNCLLYTSPSPRDS